MPFSRSRSPESSTRSATWAPARNAPDCHSIASTSVVVRGSTCATIATLRRSSRVARRAERTGMRERLRVDQGRRQDYGVYSILALAYGTKFPVRRPLARVWQTCRIHVRLRVVWLRGSVRSARLADRRSPAGQRGLRADG